jgi:hypothetical protein
MNTSLTEVCKYLEFDKQDLELLEQRDTSDVWRQLAIWILVDPKDGVIRLTKPNSIQYDAISNVAQLYIDDCKDAQVWEDAATAARAATNSAAYAAYEDDADAHAVAGYVFYSAADYVAHVASYATEAAYAAAYAAEAAYYAAKAAYAAAYAAYEDDADAHAVAGYVFYSAADYVAHVASYATEAAYAAAYAAYEDDADAAYDVVKAALDAASDKKRNKLLELIKAAPLIQTPAIIDSHKNENKA